MKGLQNFLELLQNNWPTISTIIILILGLYLRVKKLIMDWQSKTAEEQEKELQEEIEKAKKAIAEYILSLVSRAEIAYKEEGSGLGQIKRAEIFEKIYDMFPILIYVADQEDFIAYVDEQIDEALEVVREKIRASAGISSPAQDSSNIDDGK